MVKIVTDSTSDIPAEIARDLGITIVPCYVRFGKEEFRDGIDLKVKDFYPKLVNSTTVSMLMTIYCCFKD